MKKRVFSILLVLSLFFSLSVPASALSFSDLEGHWAKECMEDLANRGYLSGYEDGTIRPDNSITTGETLALLSRFYELEDEAVELIYLDYGQYVEETVPSSVSWAYDELAVCLAAGIITEDELKGIDLTAAIQKELLSVFLVRSMQLQSAAEALAGAELSFNDLDDITESYIGYIAELVSLGIVKGDGNNNFTPNLNVTRAVAATMVSRSIDYLETVGTTLAIEAYDGKTRTEGIIISVSGKSSIELCGFDGLTREYTVTASSSVKVNNTAKTLSSIYVGCYAKVTDDEGTVTDVQITSDATVKWVQGVIHRVYSSASTQYIYITDLESGANAQYLIPSGAEVVQYGTATALSALKGDNFVTLKLVNDVITEVCSEAGDRELTGSISEIMYGTTVTLKVKDAAGIVYVFPMDITDLPTILRGNTTISIDRLSVGDEVTVTTEGSAAASIVAEGSENTITGELTSIITSIDGTKWVITAEDGSTSTLSVDENAGVFSGSTAILLSDIRAGDTVTVVVYGSTITEIYLASAAISTTKVAGTVLAIDTTARTVTVLTSANKLVYVSTSSVVSIITASTGNTIVLSAIPVNSGLVAYGTYSNSTTFVAKSIIIE